MLCINCYINTMLLEKLKAFEKTQSISVGRLVHTY